MGLQQIFVCSDEPGLFGAVAAQLREFAFDSGTQLVDDFELVRALPLTRGLQ
jgi:hypothetical protein